MYVYLQPDFAVTPPGSTDANQFTQIRDWYADCYIDPCKVHRVRVGSSKIPYGWRTYSLARIVYHWIVRMGSIVRHVMNVISVFFYYYTPESAQDFFQRSHGPRTKRLG